jgi:hypothetical protein
MAGTSASTQAPIDLTNSRLLAATPGGQIVAGNPYFVNPTTADQALVLAAWLVRVAQPHTANTFSTIQTAVNNS